MRKQVQNGLFVLLALFLTATSLNLQGQIIPEVSKEIPDCYTHSYTIKNGDLNLTLKNTNSISLENISGDKNQEWQVLPLHPSSSNFILSSRENGYAILNNQGTLISSNNILESSFFNIYKKDDNNSILLNGTTKAWNRGSDNLVNLTSYNGDEKQVFSFVKSKPLKIHIPLKYGAMTDGIYGIRPDEITSYDDSRRVGSKTKDTLLFSTFIPYVYVNDPRYNKAEQALQTPYYRVEKYSNYKLVYYADLQENNPEEVIYDYYIGLENADNVALRNLTGLEYNFTQNLGHFVIVNSKNNIEQLLNYELNYNYDRYLGINCNTVDKSTNNFKLKKSLKFDYNGKKRAILQYWLGCYEIRVYRMNELEPIQTFDILDENNTVLKIYTGEGNKENIGTIVLGLNDIKKNDINLKVYPNPSLGSFSFNIEDNLRGKVDIEILDVGGKLIKKIDNAVAENIYETGLSKGTYVLVFNINGNKINKKLIIQ